ncbi:MAG: hypothetical protein JSU85_03365 [Candidatus Zixiibacteriota bacterium]|nr:MAG: hypothetical protein JSU85_03365 [candidate division Zixibacteria bacterium]
MSLFKSKKRKPISISKKQPAWNITVYSQLYNQGTEDEFDDGYIEFTFKDDNTEEIQILKEMAWLRGEKRYEKSNKPVPTLLDIWKMLIEITPGTIGIKYKFWLIQRHIDCFIYLLSDSLRQKIVYKNVISDFTTQKQDFASFLKMLDSIQNEEHNKENKQVINLDQRRKEA